MRYRITETQTIGEGEFAFEISHDRGRTWGCTSMFYILHLISQLRADITDNYWRLLLEGRTVMVMHHFIRCKPIETAPVHVEVFYKPPLGLDVVIIEVVAPVKPPTLSEVLSMGGGYKWEDLGHNKARRNNIVVSVDHNGKVFPSYHVHKACLGRDAGLLPEAIHALSEWIAAGHHKNQ